MYSVQFQAANTSFRKSTIKYCSWHYWYLNNSMEGVNYAQNLQTPCSEKYAVA